MSSTSLPNVVDSDAPKERIEDDRLGFGPLAKNVSSLLLGLESHSGFVIGIDGAWGSGKSTFMNFVCSQLPEGEYLIVKFNPRWYSSDDDLAKQLIRKIGQGISGSNQTMLKLKDDFFAFISIIDINFGVASANGKKAADLLGGNYQSILSSKDKISEAIQEAGLRIVVVIDDMDRLYPDELLSMIRTIRWLADFKNVAYLMSYDREVVNGMFISAGVSSGYSFLEKIVQVHLHLPMPHKQGVCSLFMEQLDILYKERLDSASLDKFQKYFHQGIKYLLMTPRDVVRVVNALRVTSPGVVADVRLEDFIAIECIRVLEPRVYDAIREAGPLFYGSSDRLLQKQSNESIVNALKFAVSQCAAEVRKEAIERLILMLFPKVEGASKSRSLSYDYEEQWRRDRRICSSDRFEIYFRFGLLSKEVSDSAVLDLLQIKVGENRGGTIKSEEFSKALTRFADMEGLDGRSQLPQVLEKIDDNVHRVSDFGSLKSIFISILSVADRIDSRKDYGTGFLAIESTPLLLSRICVSILKRFPLVDRGEIFRLGLIESNFVSPNFLVYLCDGLAVESGIIPGRDSDLDTTIEAEKMEEILTMVSDSLTKLLLCTTSIRAIEADCALRFLKKITDGKQYEDLQVSLLEDELLFEHLILGLPGKTPKETVRRAKDFLDLTILSNSISKHLLNDKLSEKLKECLGTLITEIESLSSA